MKVEDYKVLIMVILERAKLNSLERNHIRNLLEVLSNTINEEKINDLAIKIPKLIEKRAKKIDENLFGFSDQQLTECFMMVDKSFTRSEIAEQIKFIKKMGHYGTPSELIMQCIHIMVIERGKELKRPGSVQSKPEETNYQNNYYKQPIKKEETVVLEPDKSVKNSPTLVIKDLVLKFDSLLSREMLFSKIKEELFKVFPHISIDLAELLITLELVKNQNKKRLLTKNNPNLRELYYFAASIYKTLPQVLATQNSGLSLEEKQQLVKCIDEYQILYDKYINYYNKLNNEEKEAEEASYYQSKGARNILGIGDEFYILPPDELIFKVNKAIKKMMVARYYDYDFEKNVRSVGFVDLAITYMSPEEVGEVYRQIRMCFDKTPTMRKTNTHNNIQRNFTYSLLHKICPQLSELTDEEKDVEIKRICETYLQEKVFFKEIKETVAIPSEGKTQACKDMAQERFYGMNKLMQTLMKTTETYRRFRELMEKEQLNKQEQEELTSMFRR